MSKKKFTDGLESLFGVAHEDELQDGSPLLEKTAKESTTVVKERKKRSTRSRSRSGKNFTTDLESLFTNAVKETIEEKTKEVKEQADRKAALGRRIRRKAVGGLDALIRQTIVTDTRAEVEASSKKRVTFIFDKKKLLRLKSIARAEKAYLKDIIGEVVSEFIQRYEQENGQIPEIQFKS